MAHRPLQKAQKATCKFENFYTTNDTTIECLCKRNLENDVDAKDVNVMSSKLVWNDRKSK